MRARSGFKAAALSSASASSNGEVARRFACPKPSEAGLCPWPLIRLTDCAGALKEMISRVLENLPIFRFGVIGWELCFQAVPPYSVFLRPTAPGAGCLGFSAENPLSGPEPRSRNKSRGLAPFSRLVPSASSTDHQMTPAWFARLSRASRSRLAHWRTGCSRSLWSRSSLAHLAAPDFKRGWPPLRQKYSAALRPKASRGAGLRDGLSCVEKNAACLARELGAQLFLLPRRKAGARRGSGLFRACLRPVTQET